MAEKSAGVQYLGSDGMPISSRDLSNAAGYGSEFLPPLWLLEKWVSVSRSSAPLLGLADTLPLPPGCFEVNLPRWRAFAPAHSQWLENTPEPNNLSAFEPVDRGYPEDSQTDHLTSEVVLISQYTVVSEQALDRGTGPGVMDAILVQEAAEAYAAEAERQLIYGLGTDGELQGVYGPSTFALTYTDSSPTPAEFIQSGIGAAIANIGAKRLKYPECILMAPRRAGWVFTQTDGSGNEPTTRPGTGLYPKAPFDGGDVPLGPVGGLPVYVDGALPTTVSGDQDLVVVGRPSDLLVLQSDPIYEVFREPYAAQLAVQIRARVYIAAIIRYPDSFATILGTGLADPYNV
jgi:hypothetical protein